MMYAVQNSLNASAVWLLNEIGLEKGLQSAEAFGIKTDPDVGLAVALGGGVQTSPFSMARAYSAFANNGVIMEPYLIREIVDFQGDKVAVHQPEAKKVVSEQTAWYMTEMLLNVLIMALGPMPGLNILWQVKRGPMNIAGVRETKMPGLLAIPLI